MTYVLPGVISEREDAHLWDDGRQDDAADEDCVWCSTLWLVCAAFPARNIPHTHAEAEALRGTVTGPLGGSTMEQAQQAVRLRYGITLTDITGGDSALWAALAPGHAVALIGAPSNLPVGNPIRTYVPTFNGLHATVAARVDASDTVLYFDPEAPNGAAGRVVTKADLLTFYQGDHALVAPLAVVPAVVEDPMLAPITELNLVTFDAPIGTDIFDEAGKFLFKTTVAIADRNSPYGVMLGATAYRVFAGTVGSNHVLMLIKRGDCRDMKDPVLAAKQAQYDLDAKSIAASAAVVSTKLTNARPA